MPDREKVISHFQDAIEASGAGNGWRFVRVDMIEDAIALLKEQEPVEPMLKREGWNKYHNWYVCPVCDQELVYEQNYCSECGRAVKWE